MPSWTDENGNSSFGKRWCKSCYKEFETGGLIPAHRCTNNKVVKEIHYFDGFLSESRFVYVTGKELQDFETKEKQLTEKKKRAKKSSGITIKINGATNKEVVDILCSSIKSHMYFASISDHDVKLMFKCLKALENS